MYWVIKTATFHFWSLLSIFCLNDWWNNTIQAFNFLWGLSILVGWKTTLTRSLWTSLHRISYSFGLSSGKFMSNSSFILPGQSADTAGEWAVHNWRKTGCGWRRIGTLMNLDEWRGRRWEVGYIKRVISAGKDTFLLRRSSPTVTFGTAPWRFYILIDMKARSNQRMYTCGARDLNTIRWIGKRISEFKAVTAEYLLFHLT